MTRRLSRAQAIAVTRERLLWNRRARNWDDHGSAGLAKVVDAVLQACHPSPETTAVDLGCGSGQVTLPLAQGCARVVAVDLSDAFLAQLNTKAGECGLHNIQLLTHPIETLDLNPATVDLVASNYALHHLRDADKAQLMHRAYAWLRPGGRLVIGDMMFGRGSNATDRAIISSKAINMLKRGPGGWWRLIKNVVRFGLRVGERPLPVSKWESIVRAAGFDEVASARVVCEAYVLTASKSPASHVPMVPGVESQRPVEPSRRERPVRPGADAAHAAPVLRAVVAFRPKARVTGR